MPLTKLTSLASHNVDVGIGGVLGLVSSLGITTGTTPMPDGVPSWVGYLASLGVALAPMAIKALGRWYRGEAAGDRVRAAKLRAKADRCRKAGNEAEAAKLEDKADELDAEAAEKEAKARGGVE
jgi:hypothetical protein